MKDSTLRMSVRVLGTWFGCGRSPYFPGTVGTLGGLPLYWLFAQTGDLSYLGITVVFVGFSILVAHFYEQEFAQHHDPAELVIDEVSGLLVTMAFVPVTLAHVALGVLIFRGFDMLKPFPISLVDRKVPGGLGAVADDVLAGLLSNLLLQYLLNRGVLG